MMANLTCAERECMQRAIGVIVGAPCTVDNAIADTLVDAVEMLDGVLRGDFADG